MHPNTFNLLALTLTLSVTLTTATWTYEGTTVTLAMVNYTYRDPKRGGMLVKVCRIGKYAPGQALNASGRVVVGSEVGNSNVVDGECVYPWSPPAPAPTGSWVALIGRGKCPDAEKIRGAASRNASAVILYSNDQHAPLRKIRVDYPGLAVVWLGEEEGRGLADVVEGGVEVIITLDLGHNLNYQVTSVNRLSLGQRFVSWNPLCEPRMFPVDCFIVTSVLFVSVSFIILMAISLAWLVFYYVQRFRYIHAKDRLARHLCNAARKALAKIPVKNLKATDREVTLDGECCAVCIEHYQAGEAVRTLPCKHQFHRCCVDPWLLEHRTCPMCKMDILKHYGYVFSGSTETVLPMEDEGIEIELRILSESEESVLQLDMGDGGEAGHVGTVGDLSAMDTTSPLPQATHTPRIAPHVTPVVMVSSSDGAGMGGGRGWQDGLMGLERPLPDIPISPIPTPVPHTFSSPSRKSLAASLALGKSAPTPPPLQQEAVTDPRGHAAHPQQAPNTPSSEGESMEVEESSLCPGESSANSTRTSTPVLSPTEGVGRCVDMQVCGADQCLVLSLLFLLLFCLYLHLSLFFFFFLSYSFSSSSPLVVLILSSRAVMPSLDTVLPR